VPLVSPGVDKDLQKQRWQFVLEKFSHFVAKKNPIPPEAEAQLLDIPAAKRKRPNKTEVKIAKPSDRAVLEMVSVHIEMMYIAHVSSLCYRN